MKAKIKPKDYFLNETFTYEQNKLFKEVWNFVGFLSEFEEENDFVVTEISGISVVVQKLRGQIRAFKNVCSHRHSIIQVESRGNRPLLCPYHGWAYNNDGVPLGIPKKPLFNLTKDEVACLKLKEYKIDICGSLVFVTLSECPISLNEYLGEFHNEIDVISRNFGKLSDVNEIEIKANWKIIVENTLESYHVALIHSETFQKLGATGLDFVFEKNHSLWEASLEVSENEGRQAKIYKSFQEREYKIPGYKHMIVFPNVLISSTYGATFNLSHIIPISENVTLFKSYVFLSKKDESQANVVLEEALEKSLVDFNRKVFDEDKVICEEVQKGVVFAHLDGELSDEEKRVEHFQEQIVKYLNR